MGSFYQSFHFRTDDHDDVIAAARAIARVIKEGKIRTYDMGGKNTTLEVAKEIAKYCT